MGDERGVRHKCLYSPTIFFDAGSVEKARAQDQGATGEVALSVLTQERRSDRLRLAAAVSWH
jgi:hypothetical protein